MIRLTGLGGFISLTKGASAQNERYRFDWPVDGSDGET